jgi:phage baseplate assembly protein W
VRSPEFIVLSPRRILAQVPRNQRSASIESVVVITADDVRAPKAIVSFLAIAPRAQVAEGLSRLVQSYLKILFTTPGRDIFLPGLGGGLLSLVGEANTPANLKAASKIAISNTQSQLVRIQSQDPRLTNEERLKSATLLSSEFDPRNGTLSLRVRLKSVAGNAADAGVIV